MKSIVTRTFPIEYVLDGQVYKVMQDTGTPADSKALPVTILGGTGVPVVMNLDIVDQIDIGKAPLGFMTPTGANKIPSATALEIVGGTGLDANVKQVQTIEDVGEFMGLFSDAVRTYANLLCLLPLAGGVVDVSIASGTKVYIGSLTGSDIDTSASKIGINFLG